MIFSVLKFLQKVNFSLLNLKRIEGEIETLNANNFCYSKDFLGKKKILNQLSYILGIEKYYL